MGLSNACSEFEGAPCVASSSRLSPVWPSDTEGRCVLRCPKRWQWETPPPLAVGSRLAFVASFLGRTLRYTYEITDLVPNARLVMATAEGPFPMETAYSWEPVAPDATTMTLRPGQPAGFSRFVAPVMAPAMRRANTKDLRRLKRILEQR